MRKLIALALVAMMMLALVPMASAADTDITAESNYAFYYYDGDKVDATGTGGITYISRPFGDFQKWQIPGNVLTGAESTFNTWIYVEVTLKLTGCVKGTEVFIDGRSYVTDSSCHIVYAYYALPQAGGSNLTRSLSVYKKDGTLFGRTNVSLVYMDIYAASGSIRTTGINEANTYASVDGSTIIVQVVYSNLQAKYQSVNAMDPNYEATKYFPITMEYKVLDKDGNPFPKYTRVDTNVIRGTNFSVTGGSATVLGQGGWSYIDNDNSLITFEKQFKPNGTLADTLSIYKAAAITYSGLKGDVYPLQFRAGIGADEVDNSRDDFDVYGSNYLGTNAYFSGDFGYGRLTPITVSGQQFNAYQFNSWKTSDLSLTSNGINEDAIRTSIGNAIEAYATDPSNEEMFGKYAFDNRHEIYVRDHIHPALPNHGESSGPSHAWVNFMLRLQEAYAELAKNDSAITNSVLFDIALAAPSSESNAGLAFADRLEDGGIPLLGSKPANITITKTDLTSVYGYVEKAVETYFKNINPSACLAAPEGYQKTYLARIWDLLKNTQTFRVNDTALNIYNDDITKIEDYVAAAKKQVRTDVAKSLEGVLQNNANLVFNTLDEVELTFTTPAGVVTRQTLKFRYDSVSRVAPKTLTVLEGQNVTVKVGETKSVTVKAYQDQVPVTGLPIKFTSLDTAAGTIKTSTAQTVNQGTVEITGVAPGTAVIRAYVESTSGGNNANKTEAETQIVVTVVAADAPTPETPATSDYVCKVRKLWIRSGAGTSNSKVSYFSRNDIAKVYEVVNGWAKIEYNGGIAYASTGDGKYLSPV